MRNTCNTKDNGECWKGKLWSERASNGKWVWLGTLTAELTEQSWWHYSITKDESESLEIYHKPTSTVIGVLSPKATTPNAKRSQLKKICVFNRKFMCTDDEPIRVSGNARSLQTPLRPSWTMCMSTMKTIIYPGNWKFLSLKWYQIRNLNKIYSANLWNTVKPTQLRNERYL